MSRIFPCTLLRGCSLAVLVSGLLLVAGGCTANKSHRGLDNVEEVAGKSAIAFVELDDQGEFWDPRQLQHATQMIDRANGHPNGAIVVLFIHGWNHNAKPGDKNIAGFRRILAEISSREAVGGRDARPVVGVFVGWRGDATARPGLLMPFSFFNRRSAALRVSGPSSTELVYEVSTTAKENPRTKVILMGHSFGGLVLERAVTQAMIGSVIAARGGQGQVFPADAVLLLNPASQAIYAKQFIEALGRERVRLFRRTDDGARYERPLIVSITSRADTATRLAFPAGLVSRSLNKRFRRYEEDSCVPLGRQRVFYRRTAGHSPVLRSHEVTPISADILPDLGRGFGEVHIELDPISREPRFSFRGEERIFTLQRRPRAFNVSPYWVVRVDKSLIPDHGRIFGSDTVSLIGATLAVTGALEHESSTEIVRSEGFSPIELATGADDSLIVLDRNRRVYLLGKEGGLASPGCIPQEIDAADRIGLDFGALGGRAVVSRPLGGGQRAGHLTEILAIRMGAEGPEIAQRRRLAGNQRFLSATVDMEGQRVYLAGEAPGEVWWADLSEPRLRPRLAATLENSKPVVAMALDTSGQRLFLSDGLSPTIHTIDTKALEVGQTLGEAGWPIGLAYSQKEQTLFWIDARHKGVMARVCPPGQVCEPPRIVDLGGYLEEPTFLRVGRDGVLWVAGLFENKVVGRHPGGALRPVSLAARP